MASQARDRSAAGRGNDAEARTVSPSLNDEVYRLIDPAMEPAEFYAQLLSWAQRALGATHLAAWRVEGAGPPMVLCQAGLDQHTLLRGDSTRQEHVRLVAEAFASGHSCRIPLMLAAADRPGHNGPAYVLHLQPVLVAGDVAAVLQIIDEDVGVEKARELPWLLSTAAATATSFHHAYEVRRRQQSSEWMTEFEKFLRSVHASLDPRAVSYAVASAGPQLLQCDRVLVLLRRNGRFRVAAATGQTTINPRADAVRQAERLLTMLPQVDPVISYPSAVAAPNSIESEALETYLDQTHAKNLIVAFLTATRGDGHVEEAKREVIGGLVAERYQGAGASPAEVNQAKIVANHASQALDNAAAHHRIFLLPVWSAVGSFAAAARRHLSRTALALLAVTGVVLGLLFVPADFDLIARGTLQPEEMQHVFARIDGAVDDLLVHEGDAVKQDQELARLVNPELDLQVEKTVGELSTTVEKLSAIKSLRFGDRSGQRTAAAADSADLAAQEEELRQTVASLRRQNELLEQQQLDLSVRSPLAGEVITWNIDPLLRDRPVRRGQLLMTVARLDGPWRGELQVSDRDVGYLLDAQRAASKGLEVTMTLASNPSNAIRGTVEESSTVINLDEQDGPVLAVEVAFDRSELEFVQPGATVTAKIHCGRRSLGFVWLHGVVDFFRYRVLSRF